MYILILKHFRKFRCTISHKMGRGAIDFDRKNVLTFNRRSKQLKIMLSNVSWFVVTLYHQFERLLAFSSYITVQFRTKTHLSSKNQLSQSASKRKDCFSHFCWSLETCSKFPSLVSTDKNHFEKILLFPVCITENYNIWSQLSSFWHTFIC